MEEDITGEKYEMMIIYMADYMIVCTGMYFIYIFTNGWILTMSLKTNSLLNKSTRNKKPTNKTLALFLLSSIKCTREILVRQYLVQTYKKFLAPFIGLKQFRFIEQ